MSEVENKDFHHPYTPYDIQLQFMKALYMCVEEGKVGIFESPTGTGKSLSLICGSLTWLRDHKRATLLESLEKLEESNDDEPKWIIEHSRKERKKTLLENRRKLEERLTRVRDEEERQRKKAMDDAQRPNKKPRLDLRAATSKNGDDDKLFELDDYDSEEEPLTRRSGPKNDGDDNGGLSADTLALLVKLQGPFGAKTDDEATDENDDVKIFYSSRTHSQLTQFAHEMRRVKFPSSIPSADDAEGTRGETTEIEEGLKHMVLGSRKALCINPKVQALANPIAINERCLDLQKPGVPVDHKCPFLPSAEFDALATEFRDRALAKVRDIEDIGRIGRKIKLCPYYASRSVIKSSEIITLPYPLLLQKSAREALNISLKNHVVIVDEAHNLIDVISNIHSVTVSLSQLRLANSQLATYARKFKARLKGKNRVYVAQVIRLVTSIANYLQSRLEPDVPSEDQARISDVMSGRGIDQLNPHKLSRYLHESKLARKVDGYIEHIETRSNSGSGNVDAPKQAVPVLFHVQSFLLPLMNPSAEGQLFFEKTGNDVLLKYLLLDPTNHFRETVEEARAVILAGGTMSPMDDYVHSLFSYLEPDRLKTFSYGHIIPKENLLAAPISGGIFDTEFEFTYEKRNSEALLVDLGRTVIALCGVIPDGVVVFFPSYEYLTQVIKCWSKPVTEINKKTILEEVEKKKAVFYESSSKAPTNNNNTGIDDLLQSYSSAIDKGTGALLLSVMGGKLSEGINFSDRLGRGVVVVGLPFPNIRSAVWQAKIKHVETRAAEACPDSWDENKRRAQGKAAGQEFYENTCMRTVNQCIGRAIRHQNDYAVILMLDRRYSTPRIRKKLPSWIQQSFAHENNNQQPTTRRTVGAVASFFHKKRALNQS